MIFITYRPPPRVIESAISGATLKVLGGTAETFDYTRTFQLATFRPDRLDPATILEVMHPKPGNDT